eukprot:733054-Rhodomonas_salina.5
MKSTLALFLILMGPGCNMQDVGQRTPWLSAQDHALRTRGNVRAHIMFMLGSRCGWQRTG